jgi:uncharacterized protein YggE
MYLVRTAVPLVAVGVLLVGCGGDKPSSAALSGVPDRAVAPLAGSTGSPGLAAGSVPAVATVAGDIGAVATPAAATVDGHTITTRGVGRASGTPDTVTVVIGVSNQASSARAALEANNAKANALLDLLRRNGVAGKDVRTSQLSINPRYDDKSATITGYQVDNTVQATLHDVSKAGALLDAAVGAVGNAVRIQQISFSIGDDSALRAQARAQAVSQAKAQAAQLAQAAGVSLGSIRSLTEVATAGAPVSYDLQAAAAGSAASVPLQVGQQDITVAVDLVYIIN